MTYSEWLEQRKKKDEEAMRNAAREQAGVQSSDYSAENTKYQQWLNQRQRMSDLNRAESLVRDYQKDYSDNIKSFINRFANNSYRSDYKEFQKNFNSFYDTQKKRAEEIQSLFSKHKNDFNSDYVKKINEYIESTSENYSIIGERAKSDTDLFSQFTDEADYKYYTFRAKQREKYNNMSDEELDKEYESLLKEQEKAKKEEKQIKQARQKQLNEIAAKRFYNSFEAQTPAENILSGNETDDLYTIPAETEEKQNKKSKEIQTKIDTLERVRTENAVKEYDSLPAELKSVLDEYGKLANEQEQAEVNTGVNTLLNALNAMDSTSTADVEQIISASDRKNEVLKKLKSYNIPEEKIKQYTDTAKRIYNKEWMQEQKDEYAEAAKEHPVLQSTATVLASPLKAVAGVDMLKSALDGSSALDTNSPYYKFNNYVNTVRETTQEAVNWKPNTGIKMLDRDYFDDLYSTVMSTGDSLLASFLTVPLGGVVGTGVSSALSGLNIGVQAATDTAMDVAEKGGTKEQALLTGLFAGVNESLWESISIGNFKKLTEKPIVTGVKDFVKNLGKSALVNATEEFNTEVANIFVDYVINRDYSDIITEYHRAVAAGKDEKEARATAAAAMAKQAFDAGLGGALQGLLMGGTGQVKAVATQNKYTTAMKNVIASNPDLKSNLIKAALKMPDSSEAFKVAKNLNAKTSNATEMYELLYYMASPEGETAVAEDNIKAVTNEFINQGLAEKDAADLAKFAYKLTGGRFKIGSDDVVKLAVFSGNTEAQTAVSNVLANPNNMVVNTIADNYDNLNNAVNKFTAELEGGKTTKKKLEELFQKSQKKENEEPEQETPAESETPEKAEVSEKTETQEPATVGTIKTVRNNIGLDSVEITDSEGNTQELDPDSEAYNTVKYGVQLGLSDAEITKILNYAATHKVSAGSLMTEISAGRMGLKTNFKTTSGLDETTAAEYRKKGQDSRPVTKNNIQRALKTGVRFENISPSIIRTLDSRQKAGLRLASVVSNYVGNKVVVYSSETVERDGEKVNILSPELQKLLNTSDDNVPYGATSYKDGTVYIDLNGKGRAADLYAYTLAHEYTHFIRMNNDAKFRVLADFLVNSLVGNGTNVQQLIEQRMERTGNDFDYEYEEFIAECCEEMLLSEDFGEHFHNLYETDKSLAQRLIKYLKKMRDVFKKATEEYKDEDGSGLSQEALEMRKLTKDVYKNAARLYAEALKAASDSYRAKEQNNEKAEHNNKKAEQNNEKAETKNTADNTAENTVKYQNAGEYSTLKTQINEAKHELNKMSVVKTIKLNNIDFKNKNNAKKWVDSQLKIWGGQVDRQNFGIIYFSKKDIDYAIEHLTDKYQQSALCMLPYVLKKGIQIGEHKEHKSRTKHTITFGAPIEINGVRGNMGAVVNLNGNHFYASRVLLPDGSLFVFSEKTEKVSLGLYQGVPKDGSLADTTNDTFTNSIPTTSENVKENPEKAENSNKKDAFRYQTRDTKFAKEIKKNNESTVAVKDIEEAIEEIRNIYEDYSLTVDERRTKALKEAGILANRIVGEKKLDDDTQSAVKEALKGVTITLNDEQRQEVINEYGSVKNFRNMIFGSGVNVKGTGGTMLEDLWETLNGIDAYTFSEDESTGNMPVVLAEVLTRKSKASEELEQMLTENLADSIINYVQDNPAEYPSIGNVRIDDYGVKLTPKEYIVDNEVRHDYSSSNVSRREILIKALVNASGSLKENERLTELLKTADKIEIWEKQIEKNKKFLNGEHKLRKETRARLIEENKVFNEEIYNFERELLKTSATLAPFRNYVKEAREQAAAAALKRSHAKEQLRKTIKSTRRWIERPNSSEIRCPEFLQKPITDVISALTTVADDKEMIYALSGIANALKSNTRNYDDEKDISPINETFYIPDDYAEEINAIILRIRQRGEVNVKRSGINWLTEDEAITMRELLMHMKHSAKAVGEMHQNETFKHVEELSDKTIEEMNEISEKRFKEGGNAFEKKLADATNHTEKFLKWDLAVPEYAFKRFGTAGMSIFNEFKDGHDKLTKNMEEIFDFVEKMKSYGWTYENIKKWENETHEIELRNGVKIKMTTAGIMSFYALSRRDQALYHISKHGICSVIGENEFRGFTVYFDIVQINRLLTKEQIRLVEAVQDFMSSDIAEWGNEISYKRYLTNDFKEKHYFPIRTVPEDTPFKDVEDGPDSVWKLINSPFTKRTVPNAKTQIVIQSFFDVSIKHMTEMANYNAFAFPVIDTMKWLNYKKEINPESDEHELRYTVRKVLGEAYGKDSINYIGNFLKDINGRKALESGSENLVKKVIRNTKLVAVAANMRVTLLQFTAYVRAGRVISQKSLLKGLSGTSPKGMKNLTATAMKYAPIAKWKSFGFFDPNTSTPIAEQLKGKNLFNKIKEKTLTPAEAADRWTWSVLFKACMYEVAEKQGVKYMSEECKKKAGELLRDVVYKTQVVDSLLTRCPEMKSKNFYARESTAFMAEPVLSYNMLLDSVSDVDIEYRRLLKLHPERKNSENMKAAIKNKSGEIGKTLLTYVLTNTVTALAESVIDAFRNDDDDKLPKKFADEFYINLINDMSPIAKIPVLKDLWDFVMYAFGKGFENTGSISNQYIKDLTNFVKIYQKMQENDSYTAYALVKASAKVLSDVSGLPVYNPIRDTVAIYNTIMQFLGKSDLKILSYTRNSSETGKLYIQALESGKNGTAENLKEKAGGEDEIKKSVKAYIGEAYKDKKITKEKAEEYYRKYIGGNDYWDFDRWNYIAENGSGDNYSRYDNLIEAVESGTVYNSLDEYYSGADKEKDETDKEFKKRINGNMSAAITSEYKKQYIEANNHTRVEIMQKLIKAYMALGYTKEEAVKKINNWLKED